MTLHLSAGSESRSHTRRRPWRHLIVAAVGTALALSGCSSPASPEKTESSGSPQKGGVLKVALLAVPPTIDPYATSLQAAWTTARNVCEPLFDISNSYEVKPVLVDSYDYDGKLDYKLKLRSGVSFQNKEPFRAKDVVASLERFEKTPGNGSVFASLVSGITADDDLDVTISLKNPSPLIPTLLTTAYMMPASVQKGRSVTDPVNDLVCTGPYKLVSYKPDQGIVLKRWDGYVSPAGASDGAVGTKHAYVDEIDMTPIPEASTRLQAVETGQEDLGASVPFDQYDTVKGLAGVTTYVTKPVSGSTVVFNKTSGVMSNVKMRQAFLAALNMDDIMLAGFGNPDFYSVDGSIIPQLNKTWATDAGTKAYNHPDLKKVKQLMSEAGYKGQPIVWLTTKDDPTWYGPALPAQQQLKKAGFNIDLKVVDQATIIARRTDPSQFDLFSSGIPTYADPVLLPYLQSTFPGNWTNPEKDKLLTALSTEAELSTRQATWAKLQELIWTDVPFLKFGTTAGLFLSTSRTHLLDPLDAAGNYFNVWLSK